MAKKEIQYDGFDDVAKTRLLQAKLLDVDYDNEKGNIDLDGTIINDVDIVYNCRDLSDSGSNAFNIGEDVLVLYRRNSGEIIRSSDFKIVGFPNGPKECYFPSIHLSSDTENYLLTNHFTATPITDSDSWDVKLANQSPGQNVDWRGNNGEVLFWKGTRGILSYYGSIGANLFYRNRSIFYGNREFVHGGAMQNGKVLVITRTVDSMPELEIDPRFQFIEKFYFFSLSDPENINLAHYRLVDNGQDPGFSSYYDMMRSHWTINASGTIGYCPFTQIWPSPYRSYYDRIDINFSGETVALSTGKENQQTTGLFYSYTEMDGSSTFSETTDSENKVTSQNCTYSASSTFVITIRDWDFDEEIVGEIIYKRQYNGSAYWNGSGIAHKDGAEWHDADTITIKRNGVVLFQQVGVFTIDTIRKREAYEYLDFYGRTQIGMQNVLYTITGNRPFDYGQATINETMPREERTFSIAPLDFRFGLFSLTFARSENGTNVQYNKSKCGPHTVNNSIPYDNVDNRGVSENAILYDFSAAVSRMISQAKLGNDVGFRGPWRRYDLIGGDYLAKPFPWLPESTQVADYPLNPFVRNCDTIHLMYGVPDFYWKTAPHPIEKGVFFAYYPSTDPPASGELYNMKPGLFYYNTEIPVTFPFTDISIASVR